MTMRETMIGLYVVAAVLVLVVISAMTSQAIRFLRARRRWRKREKTSLDTVRADFNNTADGLRIILLLSPT